MTEYDQTQCIRCDAEVTTDPAEHLTLTFNQETGAVIICDECKTVAKKRDHFGYRA